jgi:hypothetical protein
MTIILQKSDLASNSFANTNSNGAGGVALRTDAGSAFRAELALNTGAGLVGFIQPGAGAVPRTLQSKGEDVLSVKDYGVVGDGVTDDTAAIIVALTASAARANTGKPTTLIFPPNVYKITGSLGTYNCSNLTIDFQGSIIDASTAPTSVTILTFAGTVGAYTNLTTSAVEGAMQLTVPTAGFVRGDNVKIISNGLWDSFDTSSRLGELNKIPESDNTIAGLPADTMYLSEPLLSGYTTAQTGRVAKVNMVSGITVRGGRFIGPAGIKDTSVCIRVDYSTGFHLSNTTFENFDRVCVYIKDSVAANVVACDFKRTKPTSTGYGVSFVDAAKDGIVTLCKFEDVRHALSTNNNVAADHGIVRRVTFDNNIVLYSSRASVTSSVFTANDVANTITMTTPSSTFSEGRLIRFTTAGVLPGGTTTDVNYYLGVVVASTTFSLHPTVVDAINLTNAVDITSVGSGTNTATAYTGGDAVDTHAGSDGVKISNNHIIGASGSGINIEGNNAEITGNTIIGSEAYGIYFHCEADRVGSTLIANNRVERSGRAGIICSQGAQGTASEMRRVVVSNNSVRHAGQLPGISAYQQGIVFLGSTAVTQDCISISGNTVMDGAFGGMYLEELSGASIVGNSIFNNAGSGVHLSGCSNFAFSANSVLTPSTATADGLRISGTGTRFNVVGNTISSVAGTVTGTGILVFSGLSQGEFAANSISGYTTAQTLTGTGHIGRTAVGSATYDPASIAIGASITTTVAATGAALGDEARASFTQPLQGLVVTSWVSATDVVSVNFYNPTVGAVDLSSGTLRVITERI